MNVLTIDELKNSNQNISYIIGNKFKCYFFLSDYKVKYSNQAIDKVEKILSDNDFMRINYQVIINTRFYVKNYETGKCIVMKQEVVFTVSRRKWKYFKMINT
jgi:hypothetical protein